MREGLDKGKRIDIYVGSKIWGGWSDGGQEHLGKLNISVWAKCQVGKYVQKEA